MQTKSVWDPFIRTWHWLLAILVTTSWLLGRYMDFDTIEWHFYIGYWILGLLILRFIWGFCGPTPVRWSTLLKSSLQAPRTLPKLLARQPSGDSGHSPIGAVASLILIGVISGQVISGLFIESIDFFEAGPLNDTISSTLAKSLRVWHHRLADVLLILCAAHLLAIGFYLIWKKENLIMPMINGRKIIKTAADSEQ